MKIKIKAHHASIWPSQFWGLEVFVDVDQVRFPDGTIWNTRGDSYGAGDLGKTSEANMSSPVSIREILGQDLKVIEFK